MPGYLEPNDLPLFLNASEAFVFPSLFEGFGLPVVEAMACGIPVITSRSTAIGEVAGDAALLVDPLHTESIAEAIVRLMREPGLRAELATRSLHRSAFFRPEELPQKALAAYRSAIAGAKTNC